MIPLPWGSGGSGFRVIKGGQPMSALPWCATAGDPGPLGAERRRVLGIEARRSPGHRSQARAAHR